MPRAGACGLGCSLLVVDIVGDPDLATDALVRAVLTQAVQSHPQVCCDLGRAASVCAVGVNTLLSANRHALAVGHRFTVRGAGGLVRAIFALTGLDLVMTLHE